MSLPAALRAAQTCRYFVYSEADFEVFRPAGATHCTDGGEIWHGGGDLRSPPPCQISPPTVQRQGCRTPKIEIFEGMLHAANSGTSSLVDELDDGQTLCNRLTSRLVDMGVNPDTMNVEDSGSVNNTFTLTTEQKAELNTLLNTLADSDLDGRYDQCVQKLIEFSFDDTE